MQVHRGAAEETQISKFWEMKQLIQTEKGSTFAHYKRKSLALMLGL